MKKLLLLTSMAIATIISCGKSDGDSSSNSNSLIGSWAVEAISVNGTPKELTNCDKKENITFTEKEVIMNQPKKDFPEDKNCERIEIQTSIYTVTSDNIIITDKKSGKEMVTPYKLSGDTLIITSQDNNTEYIYTYKRIKSL